jgi:hypothetical protein
VALNGHSFAPSLLGTGSTARRWAYSEGRSQQRYVRTQRYKLYASDAFFDMHADADEQQPLAEGGLTEAQREIHKMLQSALQSLPAPK